MRAAPARSEQVAALLLSAVVIALAVGVIFRPSTLSGPTERIGPARRSHEVVEFDHFSARLERSDEGDRLSVTLRLRTPLPGGLPCYVFVVARNDQATPKLWSIWPPQPPGPAITAGGHFHGAMPRSGFAVSLSATWEPITATVPYPTGTRGFDTVVLYVVGEDGRILLTRPFRV